MKTIIISLMVILSSSFAISQGDIKIVYPDGEYKISKDNGITWTYFEAPKITIKYETHEKVSYDNGLTWQRLDNIEDIPGFNILERHLFVDDITNNAYAEYQLMDLEGNIINENDISHGQIHFSDKLKGVYLLILINEVDRSLFKLSFN